MTMLSIKKANKQIMKQVVTAEYSLCNVSKSAIQRKWIIHNSIIYPKKLSFEENG